MSHEPGSTWCDEPIRSTTTIWWVNPTLTAADTIFLRENTATDKDSLEY
jgi:hypothetical protein